MSVAIVIAVVVFLILLAVAIKREWNGFLLVCNIVLFIPSACLVLMHILQLQQKGETNPIVLFITALVALASFIGIFKVLFRSRCPRCGKFFSARKVDENLLQSGDIYYKQQNNTRQAYQKNVYRCCYVCKRCRNEWSRNVFREEKV